MSFAQRFNEQGACSKLWSLRSILIEPAGPSFAPWSLFKAMASHRSICAMVMSRPTLSVLHLQVGTEGGVGTARENIFGFQLIVTEGLAI